jgi:hypothetical protein
MRYETKQVRVGEWLGDVPKEWDYEAFYKKYLGQNRDIFDRAVALFKEMDAALKRGAKVWATQSGGFTHEVVGCGLYDGWVFWVPRPCYSYRGPLPVEHIDEFYNLYGLKIEELNEATASQADNG